MRSFTAFLLSSVLLLSAAGVQADTIHPTQPNGGGQSHNNMQASGVLTPWILTQGNFQELGEVNYFAGNFVTPGYARANGQLLSIAQNSALFLQIGTTYGGDGETTFRLPDLQGRVAVGVGTGAGISTWSLGQTSGVENVTLNTTQMPNHVHASPFGGNTTDTGGGLSHNNRQPSLGLNYTIATTGIFPSLNLTTGGPANISGSEPFLGQVGLHASNNIPSGDVLAQGQILQISQNQALFAILGTTYGGDGENTFALPDFRGRTAVHTGDFTGPGLSPWNLGERKGFENETLNAAQMPNHNHSLNPLPGDTGETTGGGRSHNNIGPSLGINYIISLQGVFPSSNLIADLSVDGPVNLSGSQSFIGELTMFAGNFAPAGWAFANGQILAIASNTALFSILGTTYGGDGESTFALPNLSGRAVMGNGSGAGLSPRQLGSRFGTETETITLAKLPSHSHDFTVSSPVVPEPSTLVLFGLGLIGIGGHQWRKLRRS